MGRQIRSTVPQTSKQLTPRWPYLAAFRKQNAEYKAKQKANYDTRYRVRDSVAIPDDMEVWVTTGTSSEPVCGTVRSGLVHHGLIMWRCHQGTYAVTGAISESSQNHLQGSQPKLFQLLQQRQRNPPEPTRTVNLAIQTISPLHIPQLLLPAVLLLVLKPATRQICQITYGTKKGRCGILD